MSAVASQDDVEVSSQRRAGAVAVAVAGGLAVFVLGTPYFEIGPTNDNPAFNAALAVTFGVLALRFANRSETARLGSVCRALFVAAAAMSVVVVGPFNWLVDGSAGSVELAVRDKLAQFLSVVPVVIVLTLVGGRPLGSLYVRRGRWRRWAVAGAVAIAVVAAIVASVAVVAGVGGATLVSLAPGLLLFAVLNAVMEELWFRGVFLSEYTELFGAATAIWTTALVFGVAHVGATYVSAGVQVLFAGLVVLLGAMLAWLIRWGDSIWAGVLFHVALDLIIVLEFVDVG